MEAGAELQQIADRQPDSGQRRLLRFCGLWQPRLPGTRGGTEGSKPGSSSSAWLAAGGANPNSRSLRGLGPLQAGAAVRGNPYGARRSGRSFRAGPRVRIHLPVPSAHRKTRIIPPFLAKEQKGFCPRFCPRRERQMTRDGVMFAGKPARSERSRSCAPSRNSVLPDGSPAAKRLWKLSARPGGKDVHAGNGEQWIEALKATIEISPL